MAVTSQSLLIHALKEPRRRVGDRVRLHHARDERTGLGTDRFRPTGLTSGSSQPPADHRLLTCRTGLSSSQSLTALTFQSRGSRAAYRPADAPSSWVQRCWLARTDLRLRMLNAKPGPLSLQATPPW